MKYKLLFKNSFLLSLAGIATRFVSFLFIPIFTRLIQPNDFAIVDFYNALVSVSIFIFGLEISQGFSRQIIDNKENKNLSEQIFATSFWGLSFISLGLILFAAPIVYLFSEFLFGIKDWKIVLIFFLQVFMQGLFSLLIVKLNFLFDAKKVAILSILVGLINNVVSVVLILNNFGFYSLVIGSCASNFLAVLIGYTWQKENLDIRLFELQRLKSILVFSFPFVVYAVSIFLFAYLDRIIIRSNLDMASSGVFGIASRFAAVIPIFTSSFGTVLTPLIVSNHKEILTKIKVTKLLKTYLIAGFAICLFIAAIAKVLINFMVAQPYWQASEVLIFLCPAVFISSLSAFLPGFFIAKKSFRIAQVGILTAVTSSGLNYFLSSYYGLVGAGYAALIASILGFTLLFSQSQKYFPIFIKYRSLFTQFLAFVLFLILVGITTNIFIKMSLVISFVILSWSLRWFRIRDLKLMFKTN